MNSENKSTNLNNHNKQNSILELLSIIIGICGFIAIYFSYVIAGIIFIIGIGFGFIYKQQNKKSFGFILNIFGIILNIILFLVAVFIIKNTYNDAKIKSDCYAEGGYWENNHCVNNNER